MKRELLENTKVFPYTGGAIIDRQNFLSAIVGAKATAAGKVTIAVTHCDTEDGEFVAVSDAYLTLGNPASVSVAAGDVVNIDIDLVGCKRFIKIATSGATATYAAVLGDAIISPV